ncbi:IS1595 family transposase [Methyloligella solikamskensis]|uniref:IS1595 family transposase n=1 Tax=Methyloligella solikamskensis TaxID=1177756 RepID=A0ABW3J5Q7_9HYPH
MTQHFLLSAEARSLSLAKVARLSDEEAWEAFKMVRWSETEGEPFCPRCGCAGLYTYSKRKLWECKACKHQFSVTSGTIFASRKLPIRDILLAIAIFVNSAKGHSALQLSRDLDVQYRTAFVLSHKIREALAETADRSLEGHVEVDGAYFGGYAKPANHKENRRDRRLVANQTGKRRCVVVMREREGSCLPFVFGSEDEATKVIGKHVLPGSTIYADEAACWDVLHARYLTKRINHSECYSDGEACTNQAESFFSRLRRAEIGTHHHISGRYLHAYAAEMAWREDNRRIDNGELYLMATFAALKHPVSRQWKGYWQRSA